MNRTRCLTRTTFSMVSATLMGWMLLAPASVPIHAQDAGGGQGGDDDGGIDAPPVVYLSGVVRDFRERTEDGGHPDFERRPDAGFGHYARNVDQTLGENKKPVFTGDGRKVLSQFRDSSGRPICYTLYSRSRGDSKGRWGDSDSGGIDCAESFSHWFTDVPSVNVSKQLTLKFVRQEDGSYVFDDKLDPAYSSLGGFFPLEDELFGNPGGNPDRNFHFTFELHTEFTYDESANQVFQFIGDDDVFVFINGQLVIDLGGVHSATEQYVELNRLGLTDGEVYTLDFFFAERHRTQSNFRVQTNLVLESLELPTVTAAFD